MSTTLLLQQSHVAVAAITSSRRQPLESSTFRSSSLTLLSYGRSGDFTSLKRSSPVKRNVSSGAAIQKSLKELFTHSEKEKVSETLEFYVHEIRSFDPSDTTTTLKIANLPPNTKPFEWGSSFVFDNEVREGLGADTLLLGRERGWGVVSDKEGKEGLQLSLKMTFMAGKHKGSTLTLSGNVGGTVQPAEFIILGGTGQFRGARGYGLLENAPNEGNRYKFHWHVFISK